MQSIRPRVGGNWIRDLVALLLLGGLTLLFFWRLLTPNEADRLAIPRGDFTDQYFPLRRYVAATLAEGDLPFWNPHIYGGQPALADPQAATFYPPALLNMVIWGARFPLIALELEVIAHLGWAMAGAFLLMRRALGMSRLSSLFGTIAWGFGGYLTGFPLQQVTILETLSWLPWLLIAVRFTVLADSIQRRRLSAALGAIVTACALLAGHPQSFLYLFYLSLAYALYLLATVRAEGRRRLIGRAVWIVALLALGSAAAAVQLLPTLAFIAESTRDELAYEFTRGGQSWLELLEILLPKVVGATPLYTGIAALLAAGLGLLAPGARSEKGFWAVVALLSLLLSLGGNSILYDMLYLGAPGFDSIRSQERALVGWAWSVSLLAAWGLEAMIGGSVTVHDALPRYRRALQPLVIVALLPLLALWWLRAFEFAQVSLNLEVLLAFFDRYTFFVVMLLAGWALLAWRERGTSARLPAVALILLLIFDLFSITRAPHLGAPYDETLPQENEVVAALVAEPASGRVGVVGSPVPQGNDGMRWSFDLLTGNEPLNLENSADFFRRTPALRQMQLLHVTRVVADRDLSAEDPRLYEHIAASTRGVPSHLHRLRTEFPYAWFVGSVEQVEGRNALFARLRDPDFDPYRTALVDKEIGPLAVDGLRAAQVSTVRVEEKRDGYARLVVRHDGDGTLFLNVAEPNASGWTVRLDGKDVRRERLNAFNIAVAVPPGEHVVTVEYVQPRWREGVLLTVLSLAAITVIAFAPARPRRA